MGGGKEGEPNLSMIMKAYATGDDRDAYPNLYTLRETERAMRKARRGE